MHCAKQLLLYVYDLSWSAKLKVSLEAEKNVNKKEKNITHFKNVFIQNSVKLKHIFLFD